MATEHLSILEQACAVVEHPAWAAFVARCEAAHRTPTLEHTDPPYARLRVCTVFPGPPPQPCVSVDIPFVLPDLPLILEAVWEQAGKGLAWMELEYEAGRWQEAEHRGH